MITRLALLLRSLTAVALTAAGARLDQHCTPVDHGAKADGQAFDTGAINAAIEACSTSSTTPTNGFLYGTDQFCCETCTV
jgi:hypothetical protein